MICPINPGVYFLRQSQTSDFLNINDILPLSIKYKDYSGLVFIKGFVCNAKKGRVVFKVKVLGYDRSCYLRCFIGNLIKVEC
jgi:ABC-type histidine transport system ATPase subunit